ncbi:MAG: hypothetical protein RMJ98_18730 [Myxococcales bacterium]|nr:hypothetical protein [Polyangiaceae bacterium]MDW8251336.1 hypothetical protein [Myxococcales bacterium]
MIRSLGEFHEISIVIAVRYILLTPLQPLTPEESPTPLCAQLRGAEVEQTRITVRKLQRGARHQGGHARPLSCLPFSSLSSLVTGPRNASLTS